MVQRANGQEADGLSKWPEQPLRVTLIVWWECKSRIFSGLLSHSQLPQTRTWSPSVQSPPHPCFPACFQGNALDGGKDTSDVWFWPPLGQTYAPEPQSWTKLGVVGELECCELPEK